MVEKERAASIYLCTYCINIVLFMCVIKSIYFGTSSDCQLLDIKFLRMLLFSSHVLSCTPCLLIING